MQAGAGLMYGVVNIREVGKLASYPESHHWSSKQANRLTSNPHVLAS